MATSTDDQTISTAPVEGKPSVLIAIDKSKQAEHALRWYAEHAHKADHQIILLHVPEGRTVEVSKGMHLPAGEWEKMAAAEAKEKNELVTKYKQIMDSLGLVSSYKTVYGKPGEAIVAAAAELKVTFIIMGTRGMGSVRRTIMGSVSDYVVHHAHVPVIVCRQ